MLVAVFLSAVPAGVQEQQLGVTIHQSSAQTVSTDSTSYPTSANKRQKLSVFDELKNQPPTLKHVSAPPSSGKNNGNQGTSMFNQELIEKLKERRKSADAEEGEDEEEEKEEDELSTPKSNNGSDSEYDDAMNC